MNTRIALVVTLLAGLTGAASIVPAMAENHTPADATEMEAMSAVKLSIAEASTAAEAKLGGKAVEVSLDVVNGTPVYVVSLLGADGTEIEANVDAMSGVVTMAPAEVADTETADDAENGDENGGENEGQNGENGEEAEAQ
jgi:uncharacterized membrane protein YkoI